ncbi:MAG: hypothetical protein ACI4OE_07145 [Alphaproteobacteria bacterium]
MDIDTKALENLAFIRQILETSHFNPSFEEIQIIYQKTQITKENN